MPGLPANGDEETDHHMCFCCAAMLCYDLV
jgi:hypothetical protein